ncbi:RusA family crossover junction endodeoxyribonuclease [Nocardia gipuzkoensis]
MSMRRPPMTANDQRRAHWTRVRKAKSQVAEQVGWAARQQLPRGLRLDRVSVRVTWYAPDARRRDSDGLGPFLKAALDALTAAGVLPDDDAAHVIETRQRVEIDRTNPRITIELEDLNETPSRAPVSASTGVQRGSGAQSAPRALEGAFSVPTPEKRGSRPLAAVPPRGEHPVAQPPAQGVSLHSQAVATGAGAAPLPAPAPAAEASVLRDTTRCAVCDGTITQPGTGRPRRFCSGACRVRAHRAAKK